MKTLSICLLALCPTFALAGEPDTKLVETAQRTVERSVLSPLKASEQHRAMFSRAKVVPRERQARLTSTLTSTDASGRAFLPFTVEARWGGDWKRDFEGCVYPATDEVFVKKGDSFRPASFLTGKKSDAVTGVCEAGTLAARPLDR